MKILAAVVLVKRAEIFRDEQKKSPELPGDFWSGLRDSNPRPSPWQGKARVFRPRPKWRIPSKIGIFGADLETPITPFYPLLSLGRVLYRVHPPHKPGALGKRLRMFSRIGFPTAVGQSFCPFKTEAAPGRMQNHTRRQAEGKCGESRPLGEFSGLAMGTWRAPGTVNPLPFGFGGSTPSQSTNSALRGQVAQWIGRQPPKLETAGSTPALATTLPAAAA